MSKWRGFAVDSAIVGMVLALGVSAEAASILLVSDQAHTPGNPVINPRTGNPEADLIAFLQSQGHTVITPVTNEFRTFSNVQNVLTSQNVDLVLVSRVTSSGDYANDAAEIAAWNGIAKPMLMMAPHLARNNRWRWVNTDVIQEPFQTDFNAFPDPNHPFVAGRTTSLLDAATGSVTRLGNAAAGNATVIATLPDSADSDTVDDLAILQWDAGEEFYATAGQFAGGPRVLFPGIRYHESLSASDPVEFEDLSDNGKAMLAQTITTMTIPEPGTLWLAVVAWGSLLLRRRGR